MLTVAVRFRPEPSNSHNIDPYDEEKKELFENEDENESNLNDDHENPSLDVYDHLQIIYELTMNLIYISIRFWVKNHFKMMYL